MSVRIGFEHLNNTRDLGGMETLDGARIAPGKLFRSGHLYPAGAEDIRKLAGMVDTVVDFRSVAECEVKPDPEIPGVRRVHLPVVDDLTAGITRDSRSDRDVMDSLVGDPGSAERYMCTIYRDLVESTFAAEQYRSFLEVLLEGRRVLWHCTAGKDRAGFGALIVEEILGVPRAAAAADYLETNVFLEPDIRMLVRMTQARTGKSGPGTEASLRYLYGAHACYLRTLYETAEAAFGSFEGFIRDRLKVSAEEQAQLRAMYLVR